MVASVPRLLIAASGTGGHIFPALAVAEVLQDTGSWNIHWLGVPDRLEQTLIPGRYALTTVKIRGLQGPLGLGTLMIVKEWFQAIFRIKHLLQREQIAVVFTTGGYIAGPTILAARWLGIPVILHEANLIPGKVTRLLCGWCTTVAIAFPESQSYLGDRPTVHISTPVRPEFYRPQTLDLPIPEGVPLILVTGGSQGAVALNRLVRSAAPAWLAAGAWIVHLTGRQDPEANSFQHPHYFALPFWEQMAALCQRADLAISRAGAGALTELATTGTPAVLIPYPYAAEDHQTRNAESFGAAGGAILLPQGDLTPEILETTVLGLLDHGDRRRQMAEAMTQMVQRDSAQRLAGLIGDLDLSAFEA